MGKKAKVGKKRKDKFYHLAKETGYRARSAFKLIQLNRKFGFLQDSRVLIDLCAAPGGWLQVAANFMPISSVILGIDLVAIKPIKNVTTFQADITTDHCRKLIKKELKTWKADVVLNDGAPNVGSAWVQDAFSQIQLALSALKLASDHLRKGGWFITKVFRSKDYNALLWVLQQLFKKVHSTKPQASRNESAEIFVVCQGYLAPDKLDERFLDPKHVFKEIQEDSKIRLNILRPEKHVRQREGYPENNITLHTTIPATQFIRSNNAIDLLATSNKIDINSDESISNHPLTTDEIKECCQDIKVLGRSELKALFAWRKKLRKSLSIGEEETEVIPNEDDEAIANNDEANSADEQNEVAQMVEHLQEEESKELKKKQKHVRKQKKKLQEQLATKLASANSENTQEEQDLFSLKLMKNKKELSTVDSRTNAADDSEESEGSDVDEDDNESVDSSDEEYIYGADELYEKPPSKKRMKIIENEPKKKKKNLSSDTSTENPLLVDLDHNKNNSKENATVSKAKEWFQKDIFKDIVEEDSDYDIEELLADKRLPEKAKTSKTENEKNEIATNLEEDNISSDNDSDIDDDSDDDSDIDDRSISQGKKKETINNGTKSTKKDGFETVPMMPVDLGPEGLALGTAMVTSQKRRRDIIDDSFNRYTFNDDSLPSWFLEDEVRHTARQIPVTREEVQFYKNRMKEINARPIKKVIEAKAKKKSKLLKKLDRARKKAQGILDATDTSNQEKQNQIKGIYKKAGLLKNKKPEVTYVVAKRGLAGKKYKRPGGVKGQYKVVDPRMKKDLRAMKNKEKTKGRRKKK